LGAQIQRLPLLDCLAQFGELAHGLLCVLWLVPEALLYAALVQRCDYVLL
jgi:hypothetical protein